MTFVASDTDCSFCCISHSLRFAKCTLQPPRDLAHGEPRQLSISTLPHTPAAPPAAAGHTHHTNTHTAHASHRQHSTRQHDSLHGSPRQLGFTKAHAHHLCVLSRPSHRAHTLPPRLVTLTHHSPNDRRPPPSASGSSASRYQTDQSSCSSERVAGTIRMNQIRAGAPHTPGEPCARERAVVGLSTLQPPACPERLTLIDILKGRKRLELTLEGPAA